MLTITIEIPLNATRKKVEAICKEYDCTVTKKKGQYFTIETNDVINFFWLGANMHIRLNDLTLKPY